MTPVSRTVLVGIPVLITAVHGRAHSDHHETAEEPAPRIFTKMTLDYESQRGHQIIDSLDEEGYAPFGDALDESEARKPRNDLAFDPTTEKLHRSVGSFLSDTSLKRLVQELFGGGPEHGTPELAAVGGVKEGEPRVGVVWDELTKTFLVVVNMLPWIFRTADKVVREFHTDTPVSSNLSATYEATRGQFRSVCGILTDWHFALLYLFLSFFRDTAISVSFRPRYIDYEYHTHKHQRLFTSRNVAIDIVQESVISIKVHPCVQTPNSQIWFQRSGCRNWLNFLTSWLSTYGGLFTRRKSLSWFCLDQESRFSGRSIGTTWMP